MSEGRELACPGRGALPGSYLPEKVMTNADLERMVDTTARGLLLLEAFAGGFTWGSALVRL